MEKSNAGTATHVGCACISPAGAAERIPPCSAVPGQSQASPKGLSLGGVPLIPPANLLAARRWKGQGERRENKRREKT